MQNLWALKPIMKINKSVFDLVVALKINKDSSLIGMVYKTKIDIFDIKKSEAEKSML